MILLVGQKLGKQGIAKAAVLFIISYALLFFLGRFFYAWDSPMFFLPPVVGFFFTFFLIDWVNEFFETDAGHKWYFPVLILVLAFLAEYITLFWYYGNIAQLSGKRLDVVFDLGAQSFSGTQEAVKIGFVQQFKESAFLPFTLSCVLGWLSKIIIDQTQKKG